MPSNKIKELIAKKEKEKKQIEIEKIERARKKKLKEKEKEKIKVYQDLFQDFIIEEINESNIQSFETFLIQYQKWFWPIVSRILIIFTLLKNKRILKIIYKFY